MILLIVNKCLKISSKKLLINKLTKKVLKMGGEENDYLYDDVM